MSRTEWQIISNSFWILAKYSECRFQAHWRVAWADLKNHILTLHERSKPAETACKLCQPFVLKRASTWPPHVARFAPYFKAKAGLLKFFKRAEDHRFQWASCYTNQVFTYGMLSTQRIESINAQIKRRIPKCPTFVKLIDSVTYYAHEAQLDVCVREERNIMYPGNQKINVMPALIGVRTFIEPYIYTKAEDQCARRERYSAESFTVSLALIAANFPVMLIGSKVAKTFGGGAYTGTVAERISAQIKLHTTPDPSVEDNHIRGCSTTTEFYFRILYADGDTEMLTLKELVPIITDTPPMYTVTCVHPPVARSRDLPASEDGRPAVPYLVNEFDQGNHTNNPLERLLDSCRRPSHYAEYITSAHCCTCQFSITHGYPCRHMWRVLSMQNILQISADMFHPRSTAFPTLCILHG